MCSSTRSQASSRFERLKKRTEVVSVKGEIATTIIRVSKTILDLNPPESRGSAEEIELLLKSLLPAPVQVLTQDFFSAPLFPVVFLKDVSDFYGCAALADDLKRELILSEADAANKNIMAHVWFSSLLYCDKRTVLEVVDMYKVTRGSAKNFDIATHRSPAEPAKFNTCDSLSTPSFRQPRRPEEEEKAGHSDQILPAVHQNKTDWQTPTGPPFRRLHGPPSRGTEGDDSRKVSGVNQHFKDRKFTGDIKQSIELTIRDYNICARQHKLSTSQKA